MPDLRDAWRALRAAPLVSVVAVLSLALGTGANTAIFLIFNSLLFKPLPAPWTATAISAQDRDLSVSFLPLGVLSDDQRATDRPSLFASSIRERLPALLSAFFGAFALLLGALGLYGYTL